MSAIATESEHPTVATVWQSVAASAIDDRLVEWPPDVLAMTEMLLERSAAYRYALSPPADQQWPPARVPGWADAVADAARRWSAWAEDRPGELPELLEQEWRIVRDGADVPLADLTLAREWRMCQALLTVHAIADEACAGLAIALDSSDEHGLVYRARGRELLANTGSLARIPAHLLRVLPRLRTPANGTSMRSLSRYAGVQRPGVDVRWHKILGRRPGKAPRDKGVNRLLLPWPLRVRESDFRPLPDSVDGVFTEPNGFFEFAPSERLDLDLVDRMLVAAHDEVDQVNVVVLPESAVEEDEIDGLEAVLSHHGVIGLVAGVRQRTEEGTPQFGRNWVHIGASTGDYWVHIRQAKHHRWSLDQAQIDQYHLGGSLHPRIRWWEAIEVPRQSVQIVETGEGSTVVSLVCEDLAQIDDVADVLRSVGPMVLIIPLLDGPQLSSRWAARYASVLADDPGSTVLTLTSYGMAQRSRPPGQEPSPVIALWKDPVRGVREIPLEPDAQGVLISASADRATRRSSDGRPPVANGSEFFDMSVYQVRASSSSSGRPTTRGEPRQPVLEPMELTILTAWAEALAEALTVAPQCLEAVPSNARAGAAWRAELGIPDPSPQLDTALSLIDDVVRDAAIVDARPKPDAILAALADRSPDEPRLESLAMRVLRTAVEQRQARHAMSESLRSQFGTAA